MPEFTPQEFVSKWKHVTAREKQTYQSHFNDLCRLLGEQTPIEADPAGKVYAFEMGAAKTTGGQGWADVAKLGYFGWEYKGKDADLDKAYAQLLLYRDTLRNPPLLIVSDINNIIIRTNYTDLPTRLYSFTLDDLLDPKCLDVLKAAFTQPDRLKPQVTAELVTQEAAAHFTRLADNLRKCGYQPPEIAHFLIRLLFCLFAEDIGLLPEKLFTRLLEDTHRNAAVFSEVLRQLFRAMSPAATSAARRFCISTAACSTTTASSRSIGPTCRSWPISPPWTGPASSPPSSAPSSSAASTRPNARQLGAHYTSEDDIRLIVEPVLMAAPAPRMGANQGPGRAAQGRRTTPAKGRRKRKGPRRASEARCSALPTSCDRSRCSTRPAAAATSSMSRSPPARPGEGGLRLCRRNGRGRGCRPARRALPQLYGIEINDYAHELAQVTVWIGYIQWLHDNGFGHPSEPILQAARQYLHMDAILAYDADGLPVEPAWPAVDVIIGNPPFLGDKKMRTELGDPYVENLRDLYERPHPRWK